jgi:hypothetical protein
MLLSSLEREIKTSSFRFRDCLYSARTSQEYIRPGVQAPEDIHRRLYIFRCDVHREETLLVGPNPARTEDGLIFALFVQHTPQSSSSIILSNRAYENRSDKTRLLLTLSMLPPGTDASPPYTTRDHI